MLGVQFDLSLPTQLFLASHSYVLRPARRELYTSIVISTIKKNNVVEIVILYFCKKSLEAVALHGGPLQEA